MAPTSGSHRIIPNMAWLRNVSTSLALLALTLTAQAQLLNSSFEALTNNRASNWTHFGNVFSDTLVPRTGLRSLKQFGNFTGGANTTGSYQSFPVNPGERVSASVWAYIRSADAIAGNNFALLKIVYQNAANAEIESRESKVLNATTPRDQWQRISAGLGDAPKDAVRCTVYLLFIQPASTPFAAGAIQFDDAAVEVTGQVSRRITWSDEFSGTAIDTTKWEAMIGDGSLYGNPGWGNNELQYYTDRPVNLQVANGVLRIIARRENFGGKQYTSARIRTKGKFDAQYGRFEARIKVPAGQGLWPAFWMLPSDNRYGTWPGSGEIDIMETINSADRLYQTIHYGGTWPNHSSSGNNVFRASTFADGFHHYAVEWDPDSIRWFLDGKPTFVVYSHTWFSSSALWNQRAPFDQPFHLLLNLAVGGNWPGSPNGATPFPAELQVDWVRYTARQLAR